MSKIAQLTSEMMDESTALVDAMEDLAGVERMTDDLVQISGILCVVAVNMERDAARESEALKEHISNFRVLIPFSSGLGVL